MCAPRLCRPRVPCTSIFACLPPPCLRCPARGGIAIPPPPSTVAGRARVHAAGHGCARGLPARRPQCLLRYVCPPTGLHLPAHMCPPYERLRSPARAALAIADWFEWPRLPFLAPKTTSDDDDADDVADRRRRRHRQRSETRRGGRLESKTRRAAKNDAEGGIKEKQLRREVRNGWRTQIAGALRPRRGHRRQSRRGEKEVAGGRLRKEEVG